MTSRAGQALTLVARAERGGLTDCWYFGAAAAATPEGRLVAHAGDPRLPAYLRSAAKPVQALPLVADGGVERFELADEDLAIACGSHAGRPEQVERVRSLLERGGFGPEDLACGTHPPLDEESARRLVAAGETPSALHNNCSGNHAGMLLACRLGDLPRAGYLEPEHPLNVRAGGLLARMARLAGGAEAGEDGLELGVDGCGLPAYRMPLAAAARAYAALADPTAAGLAGDEAAAVGRLVRAMAAAPALVAGPGRFTTRLIEATGGRVVGKEGAAGFYAAIVRGPAALGLALKIAHGDCECRDAVVLELLRQLGVLSAAELEELAAFHRREIRNRPGRPVGELVPDVELTEG